ncbi:hypothetical protein [Paracoccus zeaxanthinifaciens]|nr:hypothetical protein [Paracoccus zeaxanthinifaciens]
MPRIDMMEALSGFDKALKARQITTVRMRGNDKIHIHQDMPKPDTPRLT